MEIEFGKKYKTRDGREVEINMHDPSDEDYPFGVENFKGEEEWFGIDGYYHQHKRENDLDLIEEIIDEPIENTKQVPFDEDFKPEPKERKVPVRTMTDGIEVVDLSINQIDAAIKNINSEYKIVKIRVNVLEEALVKKDEDIRILKTQLELAKRCTGSGTGSAVISDRKLRFTVAEFKTIQSIAIENDGFKASKLESEKAKWVTQRKLVIKLMDEHGIKCNHDQISSIKRGKYTINQCKDYKGEK